MLTPSLSLLLAAFILGLGAGFGWAIGTWAWSVILGGVGRRG